MKKTILIVERRPILRAGLMQLLEASQGIDNIIEALNCTEAQVHLARQHCSAAIIGNTDQWLDELHALRAIRSTHPQMPIILICTDQRLPLFSTHLRKYVDVCLPMGVDGDRLTAAVRMAIWQSMGRKWQSPSLIEAPPPSHGLSDRELEVLGLLGNGKTNRQIAGQLNLSVSAISTYRHRLLLKLGFENNAQLIRHALQNGLAD